MADSRPEGDGLDPDRFWDQYSRFYDSVYALMPYRKLLWDTYQALELGPGMRILDAGCGTGNFEVFIAEKDPPFVEFDAVDFSPGMLARAARKCAGMRHVRFVLADLAATLPFADASFDRIVSINVLYALPDWDHTIQELLRVLRPNGKMVLTSSAPDFRAGPLLADHVRRIGNIWGFRRKARSVIDTARLCLVNGMASAVLNFMVINRREREGVYHSPDEAEVRELFERHRQNGLGSFEIGLAWADQNFMTTATKVAA